MVSSGTVRVTPVSRDTLTQRVPGWVGDGESRDCQSYSGVLCLGGWGMVTVRVTLVSWDALTQRVPGLVVGGSPP